MTNDQKAARERAEGALRGLIHDVYQSQNKILTALDNAAIASATAALTAILAPLKTKDTDQ